MLRTKLFILLFIKGSIFLQSLKALAAACCGGGVAVPAIIAGDEIRQTSFFYSLSRVTDDVDANSVWRARKGLEQNETLRLDFAQIYADRWQFGASVPMHRVNRGIGEETDLGNPSLSVGYEYITDWDYHPWRPKAIGYAQAIQNSEAQKVDWAVGSLFLKTHKSLDYFLNISVAQDSKQVGLGFGWSRSKLRLGSSLTYFNNIRTQQKNTTAVIIASYLATPNTAVSTSYFDQRLFGTPVNTSLERGVSLLLQRRWPR